MTESCNILMTPIKGQNGEDLVQMEKTCTLTALATDPPAGGTPPPPAASTPPPSDTGSATASAPPPSATDSAPLPPSSAPSAPSDTSAPSPGTTLTVPPPGSSAPPGTCHISSLPRTRRCVCFCAMARRSCRSLSDRAFSSLSVAVKFYLPIVV